MSNELKKPYPKKDPQIAEQTFAIEEGGVAGPTLAFIDASDPNGDVLTYSITGGNISGAFDIDAATGRISIVNAAVLDFEQTQTYTLIVRVSDGKNSASANVTINVIDVNEFLVTTPIDADDAANQVNENAAVGTLVGITAAAEDADGTTDSVTYSLSESAGGRFAIDTHTGVVRVAAGIDRESIGSSVDIRVLATSADGSTAEQTFAIHVDDVDESDVSVPVDANLAADEIAEDALVGTSVGITVAAVDPDATNSVVTYGLSNSAGGRFAINAQTGVVTTAAILDRESAASHNITVVAASADGSTTSQDYTIAVNDVDEFDVSAVADTDAAPNEIDENALLGTAVGITGFASDGDATNSGVTYSLAYGYNAFEIDPLTGVVTVAGLIDRELTSAYSLAVIATSADGSTQTGNFLVSVNDVNEFIVQAPFDADGTPDAVDENAAVGTIVGIRGASWDLDATNSTVTYSLSDSAGGRFAVDEQTGVVTVAGPIDRESDGASLNIQLAASSSDGSRAAVNYTIAVNDVDEFDVSGVADTDAAPNEVDENAPIGATVGLTAAAIDADATNSAVTYSLVNDAGGLFAIDPNTGLVTLAGAVTQTSVGGSLDLRVLATSADHSTTEQDFTIAVNNVNEAPIALYDVFAIETNNTVFGVDLSQFFSDPDNDPLRYLAQFVDTNGDFLSQPESINITTGEVYGFAREGFHLLKAYATDPSGLTATMMFELTSTIPAD